LGANEGGEEKGKGERRTFLEERKGQGDRGEYSLPSGNGFLDLALRGRNNADVTSKGRSLRECDEQAMV